MLVFTNRLLDPKEADASALTNRYTSFSDALGCVQVSAASKGWKVSDAKANLSDTEVLKQLRGVLNGSKPVLLFLHGNSTAPAACFERCHSLEQQYPISVIGYSWPSEGALPDGTSIPEMKVASKKSNNPDEDLAAITSKRSLEAGWAKRKGALYGQAKVNAQHGKEAFARLLRLLAAARLESMRQKVSLAAYSLGCHLLHYTINEQDAEASLSAMYNVALIAGCTGADKHSAWVSRIHPLQRVYITYTKADSVLYAAHLIDGDIKLGTDPGRGRAIGEKYRYIDFEGAKVKFGAHRYFIADPGKSLAKSAKLLFSRIFSSELDYSGGVSEMKKVYPHECDIDGLTCHMGSNSNNRQRR